MSKKKYSLINVIIYILVVKATDMGLISPSNKIALMIKDYCFEDWAAYKVESTMKGVDRQIKAIQEEALKEAEKEIEYRYSEAKQGETPLGGEMRLSAPWNTQDNEQES